MLKLLYLILVCLTPFQVKGDLLILNETLHSGFGAEFSAVLGALDVYQKGKYDGVKVDLNCGLFFDPVLGPNWWEYYFAPLQVGDQSSTPHHSSLNECCSFSQSAYNELSRFKCYQLIKKYIKVKPEIQEEASTFVKENFNNHFVIGVHHRGTDKSTEVAMVQWDLTLKVLKHTIKHLSKSNLKKLKIYVATDDQHFLDNLISLYPSFVIYGDFSRSTDNKPLHYYESDYYSNNYEKGKEALIEALILSRCNALIRPAPSGFSWIPMVFNPKMPVNSINCGGWVYPGEWSPSLKASTDRIHVL